jgi:hypothetical protein
MKMIGRAAASARSELAGPSLRSATSRVLLLAALVSVIVLAFAAGSPRASGVFAPTISIETSTTRASAHPDARITIDNTASDENIASMTMSLPDYFWGSLAAVSQKCLATEVYDTVAHCPSASRIGTATASAKIEDPDTGTMVDGVLSGGIYLTEDLSGLDQDPAGVAIIVDAKVGGVDLGKVLVTGRAVMRTEIPAGWDVEASPQIVGLDTIVDSIPSSIWDSVNNRTVSYFVKTMQIDLQSELKDASQPGYLPPLLTNPSKCGTYQMNSSMTSETTSAVATPSANYTVDGCDTVRFDPDMTTTFSGGASIGAGTSQGMKSTLAFPTASGQPDANGSISRLRLRMPRGIGANLAAFGSASDMCEGGSMNPINISSAVDGAYFMPGKCSMSSRPQAKVGIATIHTPLLPDPMIGDVYAINKLPIPGLAIVISDTTPGNPKGVNTSFGAIPDDACSSSCTKGIVANFTNLPDVPVTSIEVDLDRPDRPAPTIPSPGRMLSGKLLSQASAGDTDCQKNDDFAFDAYTPSTTDPFSSVSTIPTSGCTSTQKFAPTTGPWGQATTSTAPTYSFTYTGATANLLCGIDMFSGHSVGCPAGSSTTGTTGSITGSSLGFGSHAVFANTGVDTTISGGGLARFSAVRPVRSYDNTVPTTTLSAGPGYSGGTGTTALSRPTFGFNASEASDFQCSLDDGAFLPCGSDPGTGTVNHQLAVADSLDASDTVHTFRVRAQDDAGNVDLTPASASFKVVKPFAPQVSVALTSLVARDHPEMTVTVTNDSHEDIKNLQMNLPDGFFGALTGVVSLCSIADADAGTCAAGSQVGTVDASAVIDRSTATINGKIFLTDPRTAGDPAGLTILVKPKIQDVTFNPTIINARLMVRGEAQGINTVALNIPNTTTSTVNEVSEFDVRSMTLKLKNNNAAPQKLLTNPSSCGNRGFPTTFDGRDGSSTSAEPSVTFTGCGGLAFAPNLSMSFADHSTHLAPKASTPANPVSADLTATLTADPAGAGIRNAEVLMPPGLTINVQKTPFACKLADYPDNCPASSRVGTVSADTPLLPEPVTGNVYMLATGTSLPDLFLRLRGRINVNLRATTRFAGPAINQIQSKFTDLPDVPLSSFTMRIEEFLSTRPNACAFAPSTWIATSALAGWNGAASSSVSSLGFDCPNTNGSVLEDFTWKPKGAKSTLSFKAIPQAGAKIKKATVKLPKGVSFVKSAFGKKQIGKKVTVYANGVDLKVKTKCMKLKNKTTFEVGFCGAQVDDVTITFKSGSITTKSKSKKLKFKVTTLGSDGKTQTAKIVK